MQRPAQGAEGPLAALAPCGVGQLQKVPFRIAVLLLTRFGEAGNTLATRALFGLAKRVAAISPQEGAATIVHLASAPEVAAVSGRYFVESREAQPSRAAQDGAASRRLWQESARLAGLAE